MHSLNNFVGSLLGSVEARRCSRTAIHKQGPHFVHSNWPMRPNRATAIPVFVHNQRVEAAAARGHGQKAEQNCVRESKVGQDNRLPQSCNPHQCHRKVSEAQSRGRQS